MSQINPFLDCTVYSVFIVHIARNNQYHTTTTKQYVGKGEVSFKYSNFSSKKIAIVCDGINQIIILGEVTIWPSTLYSRYSFDILEWRATYVNSNECFFIYDTTKSKKDTKLNLTVYSNAATPPSISIVGANYALTNANLLAKPTSSTRKGGLRSKPNMQSGTILIDKIPLLGGIGSNIELAHFEYPYSDHDPFDPYEYSTKAKYSPDMY